MVRKNLMIAVMDKQRRLLDRLVDQLSAATDEEIQDGFYFTRQAEQISMNLRDWAAVQRQYSRSQSELKAMGSERIGKFFTSQSLF